MDADEERNPFTLPSYEEAFKMRDEEKRRKKEYRETQSKLKVGKDDARKLPTGHERLAQLIGKKPAKPKTAKPRSMMATANNQTRGGREERQCMADFQQERTAHTQLSLDVKREEIQKPRTRRPRRGSARTLNKNPRRTPRFRSFKRKRQARLPRRQGGRGRHEEEERQGPGDQTAEPAAAGRLQ